MDLREDEESKEKFGQIIDLLLAAGYFRARISTLPPFDKVIAELLPMVSCLKHLLTIKAVKILFWRFGIYFVINKYGIFGEESKI